MIHPEIDQWKEDSTEKDTSMIALMRCVSCGSAQATNKQTNTVVQGFICGLYQSVKCTGLHWYNTREETTVQVR